MMRRMMYTLFDRDRARLVTCTGISYMTRRIEKSLAAAMMSRTMPVTDAERRQIVGTWRRESVLVEKPRRTL